MTQALNSIQLEGSSILIIDDDSSIRFIIKKALRALSDKIMEASDGEEALTLCKTNKFDIILCDLMMPKLDGRGFIQAFREKLSGFFTPILVLTAIDEMETKISVLSSGGDDYLIKPFNHKELLARVNTLLRLSKLTNSLIEKSSALEASNEKILSLQTELLRKERLLARDTLAATTLHSLRQPLTTAQMALGMLQATPDNASSIQHLKIALSEISENIGKLENTDVNSEQKYLNDIQIYKTEK